VENDWTSQALPPLRPTFVLRRPRCCWPPTALLHDAHHRLDAHAGGVARKRLEDFQLFWLEDAVPQNGRTATRYWRHHNDHALAVGRSSTLDLRTERLVRNGWVELHKGGAGARRGITHLRKIADYAAPHHVKIGCHGAGDLSPVTMAAAAHFGIATYNAAIQEHGNTRRRRIGSSPPLVGDRRLPAAGANAPGLGVDIDEDLAGQTPYERGLPSCHQAGGRYGRRLVTTRISAR